jgi:hypothetical protein
MQLGVPPSNHSNLIVLRQVDKRDDSSLYSVAGGCDSRLAALSDAGRSSVS